MGLSFFGMTGDQRRTNSSIPTTPAQISDVTENTRHSIAGTVPRDLRATAQPQSTSATTAQGSNILKQMVSTV
jgi:hypothetical protein